MEVAAARVITGIEIIDRRDTSLGRCTLKRRQNRPGQALLLNAPFTALGMPGITQESVILVSEKGRHHVLPAPTGVTLITPSIIVSSLTPHVDHAVNGTTTSHHPPTRIIQRSVI